jgi:hypothetical protein
MKSRNLTMRSVTALRDDFADRQMKCIHCLFHRQQNQLVAGKMNVFSHANNDYRYNWLFPNSDRQLPQDEVTILDRSEYSEVGVKCDIDDDAHVQCRIYNIDRQRS